MTTITGNSRKYFAPADPSRTFLDRLKHADTSRPERIYTARPSFPFRPYLTAVHHV